MTPAGTLKPPAAKPDAGANDAIRAAHHALFAGQWRRIITKQNHANGQRESGSWWDNHRAWALSLLVDPVGAYAAVRGKCLFPSALLIGFTTTALSSNAALTEADADRLADEIMDRIDRIGGDHAIS